jgi:hypothetical protein
MVGGLQLRRRWSASSQRWLHSDSLRSSVSRRSNAPSLSKNRWIMPSESLPDVRSLVVRHKPGLASSRSLSSTAPPSAVCSRWFFAFVYGRIGFVSIAMIPEFEMRRWSVCG